jgi:class 3 adenylate cyclase
LDIEVMTGNEQRKLAAIMFTDMVGYSALAQRDEGLALELLEEHRALLRPAFLKHQGQEVKSIGDGFLVDRQRGGRGELRGRTPGGTGPAQLGRSGE